MIAEPTTWVRVNRHDPCPVCESPDWCVVSSTGDVAVCMRVESQHAIDCGGAGTGWLHKLSEPIPRYVPPSRPIPRQKLDCGPLLARWRENTKETALGRLSGRLGVSGDSLARLGACWAAPYQAWAFPMWSPAGDVIGIRLRSDSRKWAVRGSRAGLFLPDDGLGELVDTVVVCEGPTDAAAVLDLGYSAIGRPSCTGSVPETVELCRHRHAVVMADKDAPKLRPDGSTWEPGKVGAHLLAAALYGEAVSVKILYPLAGKDVRAWRQAGCTPGAFMSVMRATAAWKPTVWHGGR